METSLIGFEACGDAEDFDEMLSTCLTDFVQHLSCPFCVRRGIFHVVRDERDGAARITTVEDPTAEWASEGDPFGLVKGVYLFVDELNYTRLSQKFGEWEK